jgi:phosphoglycerate kinase
MSTSAITNFLPSEIGESCMYEIKNLKQALSIEYPLVIMGGAKALTKLELIETFLDLSSNILVGGVLANTFLKAQGFNIQKSKYEPELIKLCQSILQSPNSQKIILPTDFIVSTNLDASEYRTTEILSENEMITDIGPKTTETFLKLIQNSTNVIFNGPLGYIENPLFKKSSIRTLNQISQVENSYLGGGDTLKLLKLAKKQKTDFTFVSMAGGAMLEFLGKKGELEVINHILKQNS